MPHLKCVTCRIRIRSPYGAVGGVGELCPGCGSLLEPVTSLSDLVGFQEVRPGEDEAPESPAVWRWVDDGGAHLDAVAAALPIPGARD